MRVLVSGGSSDIARAIIKHRSSLGDECFYTYSRTKTKETNERFYAENKITAKGLLYNFVDKELDSEEFDCLVLNAASKMPRNKILTELSEKEIEDYITHEIMGNISLVKKILPYMVKKNFGRIIFVSSLSTQIATSKYFSYIAVKSALEAMIKNIAVDYSKHNIHANILRLGLFKTSRLRMLWKRESYQEMVRKLVMQGRMGEPKDILPALDMMLAKDIYMNGSAIDLAGGLPLINTSSPL